MFKVHPEWFETPHPESNRGKNEVDYSVIEQPHVETKTRR